MRSMQRRTGTGFLLTMVLALQGCGGGSGGSSPGGGVVIAGPPADPVYAAGKYDPPSTFANYCASPRSGTDTVTGQKYPDKLGSTVWENHWLRAWSEAYYLWYRELPDLDPAGTATTAAYFKLMKTVAVTASGSDKDKFHFAYPTSQWESFATAGAQLGYGVTFSFVAAKPPRKLVVAYTDPNTPATAAGLARGASVLQIDGIDLVNTNAQADFDKLNAALSPTKPGESHSFTVLDLAGTQRTVSMAATTVTSQPVQNVSTLPIAAGTVGYVQFNDHIETAEAQLIAAIKTMAAAHVTDLVLDMRYNGGGLLDLASETAFMIAGATRTAGRTFELLAFNDKYPNTDPITGAALAPTPFYASTRFASPGTALPSLDLRRVLIITGNDTCSASESVINSLNGVGVTVVLIGGQTCGKPYGFYPADNCATTYFSIQFKGVNAAGFGDYTDGFVPANAPVLNGGVPLPGCAVADDFTHALGDPAESRLAAALQYAATGTCPVATALASPALGAHVLKPAWLMNRILRRPR